jgi:tetratricopeptide (TPR) repeat protein
MCGGVRPPPALPLKFPETHRPDLPYTNRGAGVVEKMNQLPDQAMIRRYALGNVSEEERESFDLRLMNDNELYDELSMVEDDLMDEYLAGELSGDELKRFQNHFLGSPDHSGKLRFAKAFREYVLREGETQLAKEPLWADDPELVPRRVQNWPATSNVSFPLGAEGSPRRASRAPRRSPALRFFYHPYLWAAAVLAVVIGGVFFVWRESRMRSELAEGSQGISELCRAQNQRPFKARITAMSVYASAPDTRGASNKEDSQQTRRSQIELLLEDANESHSAESEHALGEFYLVDGDTGKAITYLTSAEEADSKNAQYHNDLGAAYLQNNEPQEGIDQIEKALQLDPSLKEALFNRALAYERLEKSDQAQKAWQQYLEIDRDSPWAIEAKNSLDNLRESKNPTFPSPAK